MINWKEAPEGTTHHYKDEWAEWWFKEAEFGKFYYWRLDIMHAWSDRTCKVEDLGLGGVLTRMPANRVDFIEVLEFYGDYHDQLPEQEEVGQKKRVGWW